MEACDVLKAKIPEVEKGANVYANFVLLSGAVSSSLITATAKLA
jgi:hypothetical protein